MKTSWHDDEDSVSLSDIHTRFTAAAKQLSRVLVERRERYPTRDNSQQGYVPVGEAKLLFRYWQLPVTGIKGLYISNIGQVLRYEKNAGAKAQLTVVTYVNFDSREQVEHVISALLEMYAFLIQ